MDNVHLPRAFQSLRCIFMDQVKFVEESFSKNLKGYGLPSTNFTWSIIEYFVPYKI